MMSHFAAFANGQESAKIVGMTAPIATNIFADRIGRIEVSATMAVTAEAARLRAQGAQLVDFGAGEPHFPTPRHIKDAAIAAIEANFTRYTVVAGIPELRKAIVQRHACDFGSDYTPDEAVFTTGGKLALFNAIQVLVDHGDEVILPVPYWVSFKDIIQYAGGKVVLPAHRRSGKLPHYRGCHRARDYPADQGHHSQHALESGRLRRLSRRPGTHREAGPRPGNLPAAG